MHKLMELKEKLVDELEAYANAGKLSKDDVESIKYMASAVDHICNIMEDSDEYSGRMMPYSYTDGDGNSYARGRRGNVRRDSMGRYSREGRYPREGGYSNTAKEMVEELRDMMHDAPDASTRQEIERLVNKLERM